MSIPIPSAGATAPELDPVTLRRAIAVATEAFDAALCRRLHLIPVPAPLVVEGGTGVNDDLNGVERPVAFRATDDVTARLEVVQSLAKWKRLEVGRLGLPPGQGIVTEMRALRPDERRGPLHSVFVDQWDWERAMRPEDRTLDHLAATVRAIWGAVLEAEAAVASAFPRLPPSLPREVAFVHSEELYRRWPNLPPGLRTERAVAEHGAVFVVGVGAPLPDGRPHDGRAPDYDDWITPTPSGRGLNGDLVVLHPVLGRAVELSSMGIRVSPESLRAQLAAAGDLDRLRLPFHQRLAAGELPQTEGGGIGRSRLLIVLLRRRHIGEVQPAVWPAAERARCAREGIRLL